MPFTFIRNPIGAIFGVIRRVVDIAGGLREPLGQGIGQIARALANLGAATEAAAVRARVEREAATERQARGAVGIAQGALPREADIPEATTRLRRRYSYQVAIDYIDPKTGQRLTRYITVSSDTLRSINEVIDEAHGMIGRDYGFTESHVTATRVESVKKAGAAGTL
jgi:hypothetical protein